MGDCIFCKIIKGQIPCYKVWEDENHLAFLDIHPIKRGHTMVIPKIHYPYYFEMPTEKLVEMAKATQVVAEILKKAFNPKSGKVGEIIYGLDIDHTHIHLAPIDKSGDLSFKNSKPVSNQELEDTLAAIKSVI
jgi:histidine triad (HIT) family protein